MVDIPTDALRFFWDHFGWYMVPADAEPVDRPCDRTGRTDFPVYRTQKAALCGPAFALSRNHPHALQGKPAMRLGAAKSAALIRPGGTILMADVLPDRPGGIERRDTAWRTVPNWQAEILADPPEPPFMYVVFQRDPAIEANLRITVSTGRVHICADSVLSVDTARLARARHALPAGCAGKTWRRAVWLRDAVAAAAVTRDWAKAEMDKLEKRCPGIRAALPDLPREHTPEHQALGLITAQADKEGS